MCLVGTLSRMVLGPEGKKLGMANPGERRWSHTLSGVDLPSSEMLPDIKKKSS